MTDLINEALDALVNALLSGEQADMDGCRVRISRQACEEAAATITDLRARCAEHEAEVARLTAERDSAEAYAEANRKIATKTAADAVMWKARAEKAETERDAALEVAVKVKPLVWFEVEKSRYGGKYTADGYTIRYIDGLWLLDFAGQSKAIWRFPTIEAAKDAAQTDYEARILAAIQPDPEARQAALAKAWMMATAAMAERAKIEISAAWAADLIARWAHDPALRAALRAAADLAAKIGGEE